MPSRVFHRLRHVVSSVVLVAWISTLLTFYQHRFLLKLLATLTKGPVDDNSFLFIHLKQCYPFLLNGILSLVTKVEKRRFFTWWALHRTPRNIKRFKRCSINQWLQGRLSSQVLREFKTHRCLIHTCWGNRPWMKRTGLSKTNCNCSMERSLTVWNPSMCRDLTGVCAELTVRTLITFEDLSQ